jgi:hypothetical protein
VDATYPWERPHVLETHISTVIFVGNRALKFMKPISTPFLDQSTVDKRRRACEAELGLNRRIAPDVYLGIGNVVEQGDAARRPWPALRRSHRPRSRARRSRRPACRRHARSVAWGSVP